MYRSGLVATWQDSLEGMTALPEMLLLVTQGAPSTSETLCAFNFTGVARSWLLHSKHKGDKSLISD